LEILKKWNVLNKVQKMKLENYIIW
jgi:hypothetical protein